MAATCSRTPNPETIELLIVENDAADRRLVMEALKEGGVRSEIHCVSDGEEALLYLLQNGKYADSKTPDLIFLDLSLPKVSGLEFLKEVNSNPDFKLIPIVVFSGSTNPDDVRAVYELGANCFLSKPTELEEFFTLVQTCFKFWFGVVTHQSRFD